MNKQNLLNALHSMQLWGIVKQPKDPNLRKGRCGNNDEFLEIYKMLESEVECLISKNEQLKQKNKNKQICEGSFHKSSDLSSGKVPLYYCKSMNKSIFVEREAQFCPMCGKQIKVSNK